MPAVLTVRAGGPEPAVERAFEVVEGSAVTVYSRDDGTVVVDDGEEAEIPCRDRWLPPEEQGRFRFETDEGLTLTNEGWETPPRVRSSGRRGDAETVPAGDSHRILDPGDRNAVEVDVGATTVVEARLLSETDLGQYLEVAQEHVETMLDSEESWEEIQLFLQGVITRVEQNRSGEKSDGLAQLKEAKKSLGWNRGEGGNDGIRNRQKIKLAMETLASEHGA